METLLLKSDGLPHKQITRIIGISENTLRDYLRQYQEGGVERLKTLGFHKPQSELAEHRESMEAYFEEHPPATVNEAAASAWSTAERAPSSSFGLSRARVLTTETVPMTIVLMPFSGQLTQNGSGTRERLRIERH